MKILKISRLVCKPGDERTQREGKKHLVNVQISRSIKRRLDCIALYVSDTLQIEKSMHAGVVYARKCFIPHNLETFVKNEFEGLFQTVAHPCWLADAPQLPWALYTLAPVLPQPVLYIFSQYLKCVHPDTWWRLNKITTVPRITAHLHTRAIFDLTELSYSCIDTNHTISVLLYLSFSPAHPWIIIVCTDVAKVAFWSMKTAGINFF